MFLHEDATESAIILFNTERWNTQAQCQGSDVIGGVFIDCTDGRMQLIEPHGCRRNGEQGPSGPWFFGSTKACYARRQNSRKVVSGNEPTTGCWRLYQRLTPAARRTVSATLG